MKKRNSLFVLLFLHSICFGQVGDYQFMRNIEGVSAQWHTIPLPSAMFLDLNNDLSDLRIYGVTVKNDTVEAPYILKIGKEVVLNKTVQLQVLNQGKRNGMYFITLRIPTKESINKIALHFKQSNFDWIIRLEGSNNQRTWYELEQGIRVLSIKNEQTDYSYTDLNFDDSQYEYYRLSFKSKVKPILQSAETSRYSSQSGISSSREVSFNRVEDKKNKLSILNINLVNAMPIHKVEMGVGSTFDYYRPVRIEYVRDSVLKVKEMDSTYQYIYGTLFTGTLSSLEGRVFNFSSTIINNARIVIYNGNNQPLDYSSIKLFSYRHELVARFTEPATYFLVYGNKRATKPNYDISLFENNIPKNLDSLKLGDEEVSAQAVFINKEQEPLFKNKIWLWGLLIVIILLLAWFTFRMMSKAQEE